MNENKRTRDYSKEHDQRKARLQRLRADLDRDQVEAFKRHLADQDITFTQWLRNRIEKEMTGH